MSIFVPPPGGPVVCLSAGDLTTIINDATVAGSSIVFCISAGPGRFAPALNLSANIGGASVVDATLEESSDGGTTYVTATGGGTLDFVAHPDQQFTVIPGKLYKLVVGTLTGGTGLTVNAGVS